MVQLFGQRLTSMTQTLGCGTAAWILNMWPWSQTAGKTNTLFPLPHHFFISYFKSYDQCLSNPVMLSPLSQSADSYKAAIQSLFTCHITPGSWQAVSSAHIYLHRHSTYGWMVLWGVISNRGMKKEGRKQSSLSPHLIIQKHYGPFDCGSWISPSIQWKENFKRRICSNCNFPIAAAW